MFEINMTVEQAIEWANSKSAAVGLEQRAAEQLLSEHEMWLAFGPPIKDRAKEIKRLRNRIPKLAKAIASWLKLAAIWGSGERVKLVISFSGGRTSALMARLIMQYLSHLFDVIVVFANTGREDDRTLVFVDRCDREFSMNMAWVEALIQEGTGDATTHRVVTFETASRLAHVKWNPAGWETPFFAMVKKYGIPNTQMRHCTRELKIRVIHSYVASLGWKDYFTAIGIRKDEPARLDSTVMADQYIHFLAELWQLDKQDVLSDWDDQPFDLDVDEKDGNCVECHEKRDAKLFAIYAERPEVFEFTRMLDEEFSWHGAPHRGVPTDGGVQSRRWRGDRTTEQFIAQAKAVGIQPYIPIREMRSMTARQLGLDFESSGCSESCEIYPMEDAK